MSAAKQTSRATAIVLPLAVCVLFLAIWAGIYQARLFHESALPSPMQVLKAFWDELRSGRLFNDLITSLFRVAVGFLSAALLGIPAGIWLGRSLSPRLAFLPAINFMRNLSPLAWIPFAILWFGVGDSAAIFLIFLAAFFPVVISTMAAVAGIPKVYFRAAESFHLTPREKLWEVTLPAILPQVITTLRMTAGLCWLVVVAAEMIAGRDGLGFAVMDSRNGLRTDLLVVEMIIIGIIGIVLDRLLRRLSDIPSVKWGYGQ